MQVAIVGAGIVSASHAVGYQQLGHTIDTFVDVDQWRARKAAGQYKAPNASTDWRTLLDRPEIDVVDICTPPQYHRDIAVAALEAGKHVVCEKPIAPNLRDADAIVAAAKVARGKLLVCHQFRYSESFQRLRWLVDKDYLGKVHFARVQRYDPPPQELVNSGAWGQWTLTGGGMLMTKAIHQIDMLLQLLGPAKRVQGLMGTFVCPIESEDHLTANVEFASGALASVCLSSQSFGGAHHRFDLIGSKAAICQPWQAWKSNGAQAPEIVAELDRRFPIPGESPLPFSKRMIQRVGWRLGREFYPPPPAANSHAPLFREFFDAIEKGAPSPVPAEDGRAAVELCAAIYEAALTGATVNLPLDSTSSVYSGVQKNAYASSTVSRNGAKS